MITVLHLLKLRLMGSRAGLNFIAENERISRIRAARAKAEGTAPLFGLTLLVKDNIDVQGLHTKAGSKALAENLAKEDAPVIANLRAHGAVILGKSNMTELANYLSKGMPAGYSSAGGQVKHSVSRRLSPSGSSSGSAVAVACGAVNAAIGTDTSFSVIACAQANGICGLKPPAGTLSGRGIVPIARTLDSAGVLARDMTAALRVYYAMKDGSGDMPPLAPACARLAVNTANADQVSDEQTAFYKSAVRTLENSGIAITELCSGPVKEQAVIMRCEFREQLEQYLAEADSEMKTAEQLAAFYRAHPKYMKYGISHLEGALNAKGGTQEKEYLDAMAARERVREEQLAALAPYDAVLVTGPTNIMHFCGLPSVCVAAGQKNSRGVHQCLMLYGADEERLYRAALYLENLLKQKNSGL